MHEDIMNLSKARALAYDIVYNGVEECMLTMFMYFFSLVEMEF